MNSLITLNFSSSNKNLIDRKINNNKSQSSSHFKKIRYQIKCKSPTRSKEIEYILVKSLWSDLGVNVTYQKEFINYYNELRNDQERIELLILEKNHLRKLREVLIKFSEEISNRDNVIYNIKKYCSELENYLDSRNDENNDNDYDNNIEEPPYDILESIQREIKSYKINTVNAINRMMIVREMSSYYELNKKWDISNINRSYSFNQNYLLTMIKDIEFLNNSVLLNFIQTNNNYQKVDLFLSNWKYIIINEKTKLRLVNTLELENEINKCKYIIMQDEILNRVKKENKKYLKQKNLFHIKTPHGYNTALNNNVSTLSKNVQNDIFLANDNDEKKFYEMFGHNKINLSRALYYLKKKMGNKYENLFYNENENDIDNNKKNMKIMNKIFTFPMNEENDYCESYNENNSELNIINNRNYLEYLNKNKWNCSYKTSNDTRGKNKSELINKNFEDLKFEKNSNIFKEKEKSNNSVKKKKKIKKKQKKETIETYRDKKERINNNEKIKNKENENNIKITENEENKKEEKEIKEKKEEKEKEKTINKFEIENNKVENIISLSIIIENKKENDEETKNKEINDEKLNKKITEENENIDIKKHKEKDSSRSNSKIEEDNNFSKLKLLQYRQYTEEEIKKFNKEYC